jgi:peptidoglycan/LPS O-acetylase OafA/YrhL
VLSLLCRDTLRYVHAFNKASFTGTRYSNLNEPLNDLLVFPLSQAYTSTENGVGGVSPKVSAMPKQKWILSKIFGYFPLHFVTLLLFSPVFLYADVYYNGWFTAFVHGVMSLTLTQAWAPNHAEVWNAPTWFLSALSFATAVLPYCLPALSSLSGKNLVKTGYWIFVAYMLPKLGYMYDTNTWTMAEGITAPKLHPNLAVFNVQRFSPVFAVAEVLLGVIACRIVMLDGADGKGSRKTNALSTIVPMVAMIGFMVARAVGLLNISDMLFRGGIFIPLFLRFLMAAHRNTVKGENDGLLTVLQSKPLVTLGNLAFPIFIVHGPIGQIFFKKLIANKLWGRVLAGPENFGLYLLATVGTAWVLQKTVLQNKSVGDLSSKAVDSLSSWM